MSGGFTIGIDLGGTNIRAGLVDDAGRVHLVRRLETERGRGFDHVFERLVGLVGDLVAAAGLTLGDIRAIGFGVPGPMSRGAGVVFKAPNLPGWENIPLRARFTEAVGLPVVLENDANAAALGEFIAGAGRDGGDLLLYTLGTGIGGGLVLGGRLWLGCFDTAAEVGHMLVQPNGRACPCGQKGCLERYASANAIGERAAEALASGEASALRAAWQAGGRVTSREVGEAARRGDALAQRVWDEACYYLAFASVTIQHVVNVRRIVLGGGLIQAGAQLLEPVRRHFDALAWRIAPDRPTIELAQLGDDAGVIGAAEVARRAVSSPGQ